MTEIMNEYEKRYKRIKWLYSDWMKAWLPEMTEVLEDYSKHYLELPDWKEKVQEFLRLTEEKEDGS